MGILEEYNYSLNMNLGPIIARSFFKLQNHSISRNTFGGCQGMKMLLANERIRYHCFCVLYRDKENASLRGGSSS